MNLIAQPIKDPTPVFKEIMYFMSDDYGAGYPSWGFYWGVFDRDTMAGAFWINPWNMHCYEIHGGVSRAYWGTGAEICWELGNTLFNATPCNKIVCPVPEYNHLMRKCLELCGLKEEGRIVKAFCKNMKYHDIIMYGIRQEERRPLWHS